MSETIHIHRESGVRFAEISAPPMNLLGPELVRDLVNAIALASADALRRDSDLFGNGFGRPEAQARIRAAMQHGLQSRDAELDLAGVLG